MNVILSMSICLTLSSGGAAEERIVQGRVVREGKPVAGAAVAPFWRANGSTAKADGSNFDLTDDAQLQQYWGNVGKMAPSGKTATTSGPDGRFSLALKANDRVVFAIDPERMHGRWVDVADPVNPTSILKLELQPLVTIRGHLRSAIKSGTLGWSHVYVELPPNPTRPLSSNRLVSCGSFTGRFEFRLPPGEYRLHAYGVSDLATDVTDRHLQPWPTITAPTDRSDLDLGVLDLTTAPPDLEVLKARAKQEGRWSDYTQHFGEPAPTWHAVAGRGIEAKSAVSDFRGKWVMVYFWGLGCPPCLGKGIPKMTEFYHQHAAHRDLFELVGVFIDFNGEISDFAQLDAELLPIETHVWKGKKIPFPLVVDNTFTSWERFGIPGLGTVVLIDPAGKLHAGDETTLAAILTKSVVR